MVTKESRLLQVQYLELLFLRKRMTRLISITSSSSSSSTSSDSSNSSSNSSQWYHRRRKECRKLRLILLDDIINCHRRQMNAASSDSSRDSDGDGDGGRSIYNREEITSKYNIIKLIGSGAYADVYKASRSSDGVFVALKEVHDTHSAFREIEMLKLLKGCENVVEYYEYFWDEDEDEEDVVIVLEYFVTDLASVISDAKKCREESVGFSVEEIKGWMVQILLGVDACHMSNVVHRDLKPSNLLVSGNGVLKLADFGQARVLLKPGTCSSMNGIRHNQQNDLSEYQGNTDREQLFRNFVEQRAKFPSTDDMEAYEGGGDNDGPLTSFIGTRWFRAPELLYGSSNYGIETDLWSLGCIFAELLNLEPIFPGTSEMDQLARIFNVLGNLTEENYPGCSNLPIYGTILFNKREKPVGIEGCLPGRSPDEILLVKKLLCFDPTKRVTAKELLQGKYLNEEPFPAAVCDLRVPKTNDDEETCSGDENDTKETNSD